MAIQKRFIHFKKFSDFNSKKLSANEANTQYTVGVSGAIQNGEPDILYQSYVWIKDTQQQWTHGRLYNGIDTPIVKGDAENSAVLDGEYEGYSNKAISQISVAVGAATTAGLKGWYYTKVNLNTNSIWLSNDRLVNKIPVIGTVIGLKIETTTATEPDDKNFTCGWKVGDEVTIVNDKKYERCAKISSINGNMITLDRLPFTSETIYMSAPALGDFNEPDEFSITAIKITDNETLKTRTLSSYDKGGVDFGGGSLSEGVQTYSLNIGAHAEGIQTVAYGQYSHTEGFKSQAGYAAHAEGLQTEAIGRNSHAEGNRSKSIGDDSHAEGDRTESRGAQSHAEGALTIAIGDDAHSEGESTIAIGATSHSEGRYTVANMTGAHAEGRYSIANGYGAHAEGGQDSNGNAELKLTSVSGNDKQYTYSSGYPHMYNACYVELDGAHVIAQITGIDTTNKTITLDKTIGNLSDVIVRFAGYAGGVCSHSEGAWSVAVKNSAHAEGYITYAGGLRSHAEGYLTQALGSESHAEGSTTTATGASSHAEGYNNNSIGNNSHTEGRNNTGRAAASHVEGVNNEIDGDNSHAEGQNNYINATNSHIEGRENNVNTSTKIDGIHVEGYKNEVLEDETQYSHVEGMYNKLKQGSYGSHVEGRYNEAYAVGVHIEGSYNTATNNYEHACGIYNKSTKSSDRSKSTQFSIGIGTSNTDRKNAHEIMQDGKHYIYGLGGYDGTNPTAAIDLATLISTPITDAELDELFND